MSAFAQPVGSAPGLLGACLSLKAEVVNELGEVGVLVRTIKPATKSSGAVVLDKEDRELPYIVKPTVVVLREGSVYAPCAPLKLVQLQAFHQPIKGGCPERTLAEDDPNLLPLPSGTSHRNRSVAGFLD